MVASDEHAETQSANRQSSIVNRQSKWVIGLFGQVCAGKSAVAEAFRKQGARVFDADKAVHALYQNPEVAAQVRELFGKEALDSQGGVDRKSLGAIVFSDPAKLKLLTESVIFPRVNAALREEIEQFKQAQESYLLIDAPTLLEAGEGGLCDRLVMVTAPWERRVDWAEKRGWTVEELRRRDARMLDEAAKRAQASVVLENNGSLAGLEVKVHEILGSLA